MYIANQRSWATTGGQWATGAFLMLFSKVAGGEIRAAVRHAKMRQTGQWMMANVELYGQKITLSGTYGEDGLTMDVKEGQEEVWRKLTPLPADLAAAFWKDDTGHNSAGRSGEDVRKWALENIKALRKPYKGVNTNDDQRLYTVPVVNLRGRVTGYTCLGYEVAERRLRAVMDWMGRDPRLALPHYGQDWAQPGTVAHYKLYCQAMTMGTALNQQTGRKCSAEMTPQLVGLEGRVVRVRQGEYSYTFRVGLSTGWFPIHLAIGPKEVGGPGVPLGPYDDVQILGGRELLEWSQGEAKDAFD